jgi:hypothetical protein
MFIIYINEAHAADVWNIGESAGTINYSHKTISDRIQCGEKFIKTFDVEIPVYYDNMNDDVENDLSCWPFRYFITEGDIIKVIGEPEDSEFNIGPIMDFISKV